MKLRCPICGRAARSQLSTTLTGLWAVFCNANADHKLEIRRFSQHHAEKLWRALSKKPARKP